VQQGSVVKKGEIDLEDEDGRDTGEVQLKGVGVDPPETGQAVLRVRVDPPETGAVMETTDRAEVIHTREVEAGCEAMHKLAMDDWNEVLWPTPPGSIADRARPSSPTTVMDCHEFLAVTKECSIRMIGINHLGEVIVRALVAGGILSDSGANSCMADTEEHLVRCHDIAPVAVGLALKSGDIPVMHECTDMGYM